MAPLRIDRDEHGYILTGTDLPASRDWPLKRRPLLLETSMPGVFAAGDVRYGSGKRVASAVGDGAVAIQLLHRLFASETEHPPDPSPERRDRGSVEDHVDADRTSMRSLAPVSGSSTKVCPGAIFSGLPSLRVNSNDSCTFPLRQVPFT
jgi:hypothetical protein